MRWLASWRGGRIIAIAAIVLVVMLVALGHAPKIEVAPPELEVEVSHDPTSSHVAATDFEDKAPMRWKALVTAGTRWSLPCWLEATDTTVANGTLACRVVAVKQLGAARLGRVRCTSTMIGGRLADAPTPTAAGWYVVMPGGLWQLPDAATVTERDLDRLRRERPSVDDPSLVATWTDPSPVDPSGRSGVWIHHEQRGGRWCERSIPFGFGGAPRMDITCFAETGEIVGIGNAKDESQMYGIRCGMIPPLHSVM